MERIINWGIIGLGNAALNLAKEFDKIENSKLLAVASITQKKREFFKKKFNLISENIYSTYDKIFKNKDIDIIFISLPNSMHEEFCIKAIQHNKNILVEKPITTNFRSQEHPPGSYHSSNENPVPQTPENISQQIFQAMQITSKNIDRRVLCETLPFLCSNRLGLILRAAK